MLYRKLSVVGVPLICLFGCSPVIQGPAETLAASCHVNDLNEVFADPTKYFGRKFCGNALARARGNVIEIFPVNTLLDNTPETAMFLDSKTHYEVFHRINEHGTIVIYLEGIIDGMRECFEARESGDKCFPYERPLDLDVTMYRLPS